MTVQRSAANRTLLEKCAADNGFDRPPMVANQWLAFSSTQCPLTIWLAPSSQGHFVAALSQINVATALEHGQPELLVPLPLGAVAARVTPDLETLHRLVRRAFQLSKTLPYELLHTFVQVTEQLPRNTEAERLIIQRVGQNLFRTGLLTYWESRCAITGLAVTELLRASHIKPWADCSSDAERLDIFNGLLLAPHLDAAFDAGFITVDDNGDVLVSASLGQNDRKLLRLDIHRRVEKLAAGHKVYLDWHRGRVFRRSAPLL